MDNSSISEALARISAVLNQLQQNQDLPSGVTESITIPPPSTSRISSTGGSVMVSQNDQSSHQRLTTIASETSRLFSPYGAVDRHLGNGSSSSQLARIRQNMPTGRGRSSVGHGRFTPSPNSNRWRRRIMFLGDPRENRVPCPMRQHDLIVAHLGPAVLFSNSQATAADIRTGIRALALVHEGNSETSRFANVEWSLLYCIGAGRSQLLVPFLQEPSAPYITTMGTSTLYARPDVVLRALNNDPIIDPDTDHLPEPIDNNPGPVNNGGFHFEPPNMETGEDELFFGISSVEELRLVSQNAGVMEISIDRTTNFPVPYVLDLYGLDIDFGNQVRVEFVNEEGFDAGGLRKEFFWQTQVALMEFKVENAPLFDGERDHLLPSDDLGVFASGVFAKLGRFMVHSCLNLGFFFAGLSGVVKQFIFANSLDNLIESIEIMEADLPCTLSREGLKLLMSFQSDPAGFNPEKKSKLREVLLEFRISSTVSFVNIPTLVKLLKFAACVLPRMEQLKAIRKVVRKSQVFRFLNQQKHLVDSTFISVLNGAVSIDSIIAAFGAQDCFEKREALNLLYNYLQTLVSRNLNVALFVVYLSNSPIVPRTGFLIRRTAPGRVVDCSTCTTELLVPGSISQEKFNQDLDYQIIDKPFSFGRP